MADVVETDEPIRYVEVLSIDDMLNKVEDIKEKISNQEYLDLMDNLTAVKKDMDILSETVNVMANNCYESIVEMSVYKKTGTGLYDQSINHRIRFTPDQQRMAFEIYVDGDYEIKVIE